ncbi:MAG: FeoB-associated Cys-rich membrane protein [Christensenellales bacterium]
MGILDYLLLAGILTLAGLAIWRWEKSGCCKDCKKCAQSGGCHKKKKG